MQPRDKTRLLVYSFGPIPGQNSILEMSMRKVSVAIYLLLFASLAMAQSKLETQWKCAKPAAEQKFEVGDVADHAYAIAQGTCNATSSSSGEKTGAYTEFQERWKASYTNHGRFNVTMDNGDKAYYIYEGSGDPVKKTGMNKWKIVNGTGKHKGIKGSGTCSGTLRDDGGSDWVCTGTYTMGK
jgi:hypothetical protein